MPPTSLPDTIVYITRLNNNPTRIDILKAGRILKTAIRENAIVFDSATNLWSGNPHWQPVGNL